MGQVETACRNGRRIGGSLPGAVCPPWSRCHVVSAAPQMEFKVLGGNLTGGGGLPQGGKAICRCVMAHAPLI